MKLVGGFAICACGSVCATVSAYRHHNMLMHMPKGTYIIDASGCWVWQGPVNKAGYGHLREHGKKVPAHRAFYEWAKGVIPAGLDIDHLCRTRACVNPEHLEAVSHQENCRRRPKKPKITEQKRTIFDDYEQWLRSKAR